MSRHIDRRTCACAMIMCSLVLFIVVSYLQGFMQIHIVVGAPTINKTTKTASRTVEFNAIQNINTEFAKSAEATIEPKTGAKVKDVSCGAICSYTGNQFKTNFYPFIKKPVDCKNILARMKSPAVTQVYPPPKECPAHLVHQFTQNGTCQLFTYYRVDFKPGEEWKPEIFSRQQIDNLMKRDKAGENICSYLENGNTKKVMNKYKYALAGKKGLVVGSLTPWMESMLLNVDAKKVTTLEYAPVVFEHPQLGAMHPEKMAAAMLEGREEEFEFGASYSSIEHSGLGRYGDPINPFGDLEAMAQNWCLLKPGAYFFLGIPVTQDDSCQIVWNLHRNYGSARLQHLTANWKVIGRYKSGGKDQQEIIVLQKPPDAWQKQQY